MASRYNRLWHTHFNDCFRAADDDLIVGTVNFWETLELLFWLDELGYSGWHGIDIFPYRELPDQALEESIANINFMYGLLDRLDRKEIRQRWQDSDAIKLSQILRRMLGG
jgi:xylose isomerase